MKQLSPNVYAEITAAGCNASLVTTSEGVVMIDTPMRPTAAQAWQEEVAKRGQPAYVIYTEPHLDHIAGSGFLGGIVAAQEGTRRAFAASVSMARDRIAQMAPESFPIWEAHPPRPPAITFSDKLTLHLGQHTFHLFHLPGHTGSQLAVFVPEESVVFTGDNVVYQMQAILGFAYPFKWLEALKQIQAMDAAWVVPGHGDVCRKGYLEELSSFIQDWIEAVRTSINLGMSRDEVIAGVSFLQRYPMPAGMEARGPEIQRMNAGRLYDVITKGEDALLKAEGVYAPG